MLSNVPDQFSDVSLLLQDKPLDANSSELADIMKAAEAARKCPASGRARAVGHREDAVEELERKVLELNEHEREVQEQMALKLRGKDIYVFISE